VVGVFGFLLAVGGALALARFAEIPEPEEKKEEENGAAAEVLSDV
jgi:hypothetical protein